MRNTESEKNGCNLQHIQSYTAVIKDNCGQPCLYLLFQCGTMSQLSEWGGFLLLFNFGIIVLDRQRQTDGEKGNNWSVGKIMNEFKTEEGQQRKNSQCDRLVTFLFCSDRENFCFNKQL